MADETLRNELESHIIKTEWDVDTSLSDLAWLESNELEAFLKAWRDLVNYYASHADDSVIDVETLRSYIHFTRMLRKVMLEPDIETKRREQAEEALIHLEWTLEQIVTEVVTYLESEDRNL